MPTVLEWLDKVPEVRRETIVGQSIPRDPRVKHFGGETQMVLSSHVINAPLWLIVITRSQDKKTRFTYRVRAWLRNIDKTLLLVHDDKGFVTVRGAEHSAWCAIRQIADKMRETDQAWEREVVQ